VTASSALTSLRSPKASTLRRVDDGLHVAAVVLGVAAVVCGLAAAPVAGVAVATFTVVMLASVAVSTFRRGQQHKEEVAGLKAEIETLRSVGCGLAV
jgi:lysylphosphatidylglycerol synthetase-like protein (DUF2156 family)